MNLCWDASAIWNDGSHSTIIHVVFAFDQRPPHIDRVPLRRATICTGITYICVPAVNTLSRRFERALSVHQSMCPMTFLYYMPFAFSFVLAADGTRCKILKGCVFLAHSFIDIFMLFCCPLLASDFRYSKPVVRPQSVAKKGTKRKELIRRKGDHREDADTR